MGDRDAELAAGLERVLAGVGRAGRVVDLRRLSGGASRETFGFALAPAGGGDPQRLILQRLRPGTMPPPPRACLCRRWWPTTTGPSSAGPPS
jgi:hypothetical protein